MVLAAPIPSYIGNAVYNGNASNGPFLFGVVLTPIPGGVPIVLAVQNNGATPVVSDSKSNTYLPDKDFTLATQNAHLQIWRCQNPTGLVAGDTISFTYPGAPLTWHNVLVYSIANITGTSPVDVTAEAKLQDGATTTNTQTNPTVTSSATANPNDLVLGFLMYDRAVSTAVMTLTPGAGLTALGTAEGGLAGSPTQHALGIDGVYARVLTTGAQTVSGSFANPANAVSASLICYKGLPDVAPNAPALASRPNFDATAAATVSWTFSDPDVGDTQGSYQLFITKTTTDLCTNGGFETNTTGWSAFQSTLAISTTYAHSGTHSMSVTATGTTFSAEFATTISGATLGQVWQATGWVNIQAGSNLIGKNLQVMVREVGGAAGTFDHIVNYTLRQGPQVLQASGALAQNDRTSVHAVFYVSAGATAGDVFYLDDVQLLGPGSGTVYDTGQVSSAVSSAVIPAGTLVNNLSYQWKVRTWDQLGSVGPYSSLSSFTTLAIPVVAITTPATDGTVVTSSPLVAAWTVTTLDSEASYRVRLLESGVEVFNSGQVAGGVLAFSIPYGLKNAGSYSLKVTAWDTYGQASTEMTRTFTVTLTPAVTPTLTVTPQATSGRIHVAWVSPSPTGGQSATATVDVWRRTTGTTAWTRIATGQAATGSFDDYGAVDQVSHEYKVTAVAISTATQDSSTASSSIAWTHGIWLHCVSDPAGTAHYFPYDRGQRGDTVAPLVSLVRYQGRVSPVARFDATAVDAQVVCDLTLFWDLGGSQSSDRVALEAIARKADTICYRDHRSRKVFGVLEHGLSFADQKLAYGCTLTITRSDASEAV